MSFEKPRELFLTRRFPKRRQRVLKNEGGHLTVFALYSFYICACFYTSLNLPFIFLKTYKAMSSCSNFCTNTFSYILLAS